MTRYELDELEYEYDAREQEPTSERVLLGKKLVLTGSQKYASQMRHSRGNRPALKSGMHQRRQRVSVR